MGKLHSHGVSNRQHGPEEFPRHEKGRRHWSCPVPLNFEMRPAVHLPRRGTNQSTVNAMMLLPRLKSIWVFPPAPTTMYCLPSTE